MDQARNVNKLEQWRSLWRDTRARLLKNKLTMFGLCILMCMVVIAIFVPWIVSYSYETQDLSLDATHPPSIQHWMGTNVLGRDLFSRILYGNRVSLLVEFLATAVALRHRCPLGNHFWLYGWSH